MLDLVPPQPAQLRERRGEHRARARRGAGAGLLRARLLAKRRHGRDLAAHEQPGENDERGDRERSAGHGLASSSIGAARRHRAARSERMTEPTRDSCCARPCSIRAEPSIGCRGRSPRRRYRHPGLSGDDGGILGLVGFAAGRAGGSRRRTSHPRRLRRGAVPSTGERAERPISPDRRGAHRLGLLPPQTGRPPSAHRRGQRLFDSRFWPWCASASVGRRRIACVA